MARLGIDRDFLWEFGKLERVVQDRIYDVFAKFEQATHAGVHLEPIKNVRDPRLRSIRIDRFWRGVVLAPDSGDSYTLLKVLPHDDAYAWAQRRQVTVNRATGVIEVRDVVAIEETVPELAVTAAGATTRILGDVGDGELRRLGIDEQVLPFARALTNVDQLEAARGMLPEPQYDVLLGLAIGMSPEQVWDEIAADAATGFDPEDLTAAIARSTRRVVLVSGPDELMEVFTYPFALWRIYLHPAQRRVAYGSFSGPAQVTGGPGTGKTVVALHRAKHLATTSSVARSVLVTTFTRTLAAALADSLRLLVEDDEDLLRRIDVRTIDQFAYQVVSRQHGRPQVISRAEEKDRWTRIIDRFDMDTTDAFLAQEWRQVVLAQAITTMADYLAAPRSGRGGRISADQKEQAWRAISAFTTELAEDDRWTYETMSVEATRLLAERDIRPYRHVIVDEAQDLAPWQWRLLRAAVAEGSDDLFLAGDTHQRIYTHKVTLKQVGIRVSGRSERLKVNYRTTAEILAWSLGLLRGERIRDLNQELDMLAGYRSDIHGDPPVLYGAPSKTAELDHLVSTVRGWLGQGVEPTQIAVAARSGSLVDDAVAKLAGAGMPVASLVTREPTEREVSAATMHRMKGLEFRCVAVIGVGAHQVPHPSAVTPAVEDKATHDIDVQRERCLLFVACTRAREQLAVSWYGEPSAFVSP